MGDMNELRGMALATRAAALAEEAGPAHARVGFFYDMDLPPPAPPVIPGIRAPGSLAKGAPLGTPITTAGRRRRGLVSLMLSHLPPGALKQFTPKQREELEKLCRMDGGRP